MFTYIPMEWNSERRCIAVLLIYTIRLVLGNREWENKWIGLLRWKEREGGGEGVGAVPIKSHIANITYLIWF